MSTARRNRYAARVLVIDPDGCVLLFRFAAADGRVFWATVGGELDPGEDFADAAKRELLEETGIVAEAGPEIARQDSDFVTLDGEPVRGVERFFLVRVPDRTLNFDRHTHLERQTVSQHRWWPLADLATSDEPVYPSDLAELVALGLATRV